MVKVKVIENFSLGKFNELKNIVRANPRQDLEGRLFKGDIFECTEEMAEYLTKTNTQGKPFVEVIETILNKIDDFVVDNKNEEVEKPKRRRRTIAKKD